MKALLKPLAVCAATFSPQLAAAEPEASCRSLDPVARLAASTQFATLAGLLDTAGLSQQLASANITLLAPTDRAFAALPEELLNALTANPDLLGQVLAYHAIPYPIKAGFAVSAGQVASLGGENLTFRRESGRTLVAGARVLRANVKAGDSLIHIVDSVLVPPSLAGLVSRIVAEAGPVGPVLESTPGSKVCEIDPVSRLKARIISTASANRYNPNKLKVRNELDPLVNRLLELSPSQSEAARLSAVSGPWRSLWSDQNFGPGVDNGQVYQVVSPDGYYYNISKVNGPSGTATNFLRGAFTVEASYLAIEFTANKLVPGFYPEGTDLETLAQDFESGAIPSQAIPGPIGVTGALMNIYADGQLRLVYGNSASDSRPRLFVLTRQDKVMN